MCVLMVPLPKTRPVSIVQWAHSSTLSVETALHAPPEVTSHVRLRTRVSCVPMERSLQLRPEQPILTSAKLSADQEHGPMMDWRPAGLVTLVNIKVSMLALTARTAKLVIGHYQEEQTLSAIALHFVHLAKHRTQD